MKYGTTKTLPSGSKSSDGGGERTERLNNGVGMGKEDGAGRKNGVADRGEYNTGRSESVCYTHKKSGY